MHVFLNDRIIPADQATVSVFDGGFLHGEGVYTTLRLYGGRPADLAAHWDRLVRHAQALELDPGLDLDRLAAIIGDLARANGLTGTDGRLRITVSRGGDAGHPVPLTDPASVPPTLVITLVAVAPEIELWQREGIAAVVLGPAYARSHFPELKTLNGLTTILAQRQAARLGCQEAILTAAGGRLLEGAVSNLFLVRQGSLATPGAEGRFLPGRTREHIMAIAAGLGLPLHETTLRVADLADAEEVFVASSVREVLPVVTVDRNPVGAGRPGRVTRSIQAAYRPAVLAGLS
ncbi:MAG: aminotransferase class IV [Candidatus Krumholzibacteriia bacterium]